MYSRISGMCLFLSVVLCSCSIFRSKYKTRGPEGFVNGNVFTDYSSFAQEYAPLEDIFLKVDSILFLGKGIEKIKSNRFSVSRYRLSVDLRLDVNGSFIYRPNHEYKVYAKKVDFVLSILEQDPDLLYHTIADSIYQKYQELNDSVVYDLGVFELYPKSYVFLNGSLTSRDDPYILSSTRKALFLRVAENSIVKDEPLPWVLGFVTDEKIRGIEIRDQSRIMVPMVNDIMGRVEFLARYRKGEFD